jgi:ribosomal protein S18 acetylase RimI-like enzyme
MVTIRPASLPDDRAPLLALDRSFTTDRVYRVVRTPWSFALEEAPAEPPLHKDFPLAWDLGRARLWEDGLVAEDNGAVVGFAAFTHRRWNRRTELWHLYVAPARRGRGIGRALIAEVSAAARRAGSRCIWLETSTVDYPAIQFYRRMGFELCGLDTSLYDPASTGMLALETAVYFALPLEA